MSFGKLFHSVGPAVYIISAVVSRFGPFCSKDDAVRRALLRCSRCAVSCMEVNSVKVGLRQYTAQFGYRYTHGKGLLSRAE